MAHYDDASFSYQKYWLNRQYEHESEIKAIRTLLGHRHFENAADIGGGFGRLLPTIAKFTSQITLIDPSRRHLEQAQLIKIPKITIKTLLGAAEKTRLPASSQSLVVSVRVLHHIPSIDPFFSELSRIISSHGYLIIEFANSFNFKSRLKSWFTGVPILPHPLERRSTSSIRQGKIPFVNHHPNAIFKSLRQNGFQPLRTLSVSNLRSPLLKKMFPLFFLLSLEYILQPLLASLYFGPSIFVLAQKVDKSENP